MILLLKKKKTFIVGFPCVLNARILWTNFRLRLSSSASAVMEWFYLKHFITHKPINPYKVRGHYPVCPNQIPIKSL